MRRDLTTEKETLSSIYILFLRFGVEVNVSPQPLGKLIIVNVTCEQTLTVNTWNVYKTN